MLTAETKKHIDSARQVLVGKVPDPKQQIDQITNALIYKFMDDMDVQAKDAGGKSSFFTNDLEKYAWRKLMDTRKGAQERLNLYTEALEKFSTAKQLPPLFRDIFRQAFLPYRDPETLNLFLKEIEFFDYSHSEELGNAFEYLLSIMGSQGDAGQFRTPRHIIDFIVDVIDPDYDDTILDPACGTAGFLISAYKHVVKKYENNKEGEPLTHQQKQKLMINLEGYDISSDMVKLARVNMYLHGNNQPKIYEYDSLSSEERWGDMFDVIMANPPFMSPKGGIRPHNKFGLESSRSEVLFVDYIMSHLKQNGRAGIIVPEGVIFQSGKAYKQLRKALVEDGLMAVISLPAGVFNPYAGVKTSILIFDNNRARQSKDIVFAKVEHDGFSLGAQRRPTPGNDDLPIIAKSLYKYRQGELQTQDQMDAFLENEAAYQSSKAFMFTHVPEIQLVARSKIAESDDHNLSASRYVVEETDQNHKWPMVGLGEVCDVTSGQSPRSAFYNRAGEGLPLYQGKKDFGATFTAEPTVWTTEATKIAEEGDILISVRAPVGPVNIARQKMNIGRGLASIRSKDETIVLQSYVFAIIKSIPEKFKALSSGSTFESINRAQIERVKIPLPPIEVQRQIVEELDGYQKKIDRKQQEILAEEQKIKAKIVDVQGR